MAKVPADPRLDVELKLERLLQEVEKLKNKVAVLETRTGGPA